MPEHGTLRKSLTFARVPRHFSEPGSKGVEEKKQKKALLMQCLLQDAHFAEVIFKLVVNVSCVRHFAFSVWHVRLVVDAFSLIE